MRLKEAAYLIGSLGGRPRKYLYEYEDTAYYRGGSLAHLPALLQEDGISFIILEDGSGVLLLE